MITILYYDHPKLRLNLFACAACLFPKKANKAAALGALFAFSKLKQKVICVLANRKEK